MREWWNKFRFWITGRPGLHDDLRLEMQAHFDMEVERFQEAGMSREEARIAAARRFGNAAAIAESTRDAWGFPSVESILKDIRYGLRIVRRSPAFSLVVILTLAVGIGLNTALFSVLHAV